MIRTIEISNFQSHKNTILELSDGVNVIKGRSHSGKSSIVRALEWAILNRLRGDYFSSHFAGKKEETSVGIEFSDGEYIIRRRSSGVNGYDLSEGSNIEAIRSDLPEEVSSITQMSDVNIQCQDELYYMLKETPGYVAKELNKLVGLDIIDTTLTKLNKLENENKVKLGLLQTDSKKAKESLKELDYVRDLEKKVVELESLWEEYQALDRRKNKIEDLYRSYKKLNETIEADQEWLSIKEPANEILQLLEEYSKKLSSYNRLKSAYASMRETEIVRSRSDGRVKAAVKKRDTILNSKEYKNMFCKYCGAHSDHWRK